MVAAGVAKAWLWCWWGRAQWGRGDIAGEVEVGKTRDQGCAYLLKPHIFDMFDFSTLEIFITEKPKFIFDASFKCGKASSKSKGRRKSA